MTKGAALYNFFNSFETVKTMNVYAATECPDDVVFPYLTYEAQFGAFGDGENSIVVNMWFYTDSEAVANAKATELSRALGLGGKLLKTDDGGIWLKRGNPFCQSLADETDRNIKRRYINVVAEFITRE